MEMSIKDTDPLIYHINSFLNEINLDQLKAFIELKPSPFAASV